MHGPVQQSLCHLQTLPPAVHDCEVAGALVVMASLQLRPVSLFTSLMQRFEQQSALQLHSTPTALHGAVGDSVCWTLHDRPVALEEFELHLPEQQSFCHKQLSPIARHVGVSGAAVSGAGRQSIPVLDAAPSYSMQYLEQHWFEPEHAVSMSPHGSVVVATTVVVSGIPLQALPVELDAPTVTHLFEQQSVCHLQSSPSLTHAGAGGVSVGVWPCITSQALPVDEPALLVHCNPQCCAQKCEVSGTPPK